MSGEEAFIAALRELAHDPAARGLIDDAAVLDGTGPMVATHDTMVEGVHWLAGQDPADVAWKLVAANLSDLAAKCCRPAGLLLSFMLGDAHWNSRFLAGLGDALAAFDALLLGGDTVSPPAPDAPKVIGLTALGRPIRDPPPSRADAQAGQSLWLTGRCGAALAGFEALRAGSSDDALTAPFRRPVPRLAAGQALAAAVCAMMDVSDGLLLDAQRMADASGVTIAIETRLVPVHPALARRKREAMAWGDDYELLFTLPRDAHCPVADDPVGATRIGTILPRGAHSLLLDGSPPPAGLSLGYRHGE
ncbi:thiamine-phosphate kinase [Croceicoccus sp. Ery15]|uniref:thiamine-phosphate kinase n=1 Tax=Croceicoccus sp. Ery15 TaxID=1703338 RepID=UPI001E614E1C|nr:thiamine-phosphate kinase [Croceicoccus sp. Ery15]